MSRTDACHYFYLAHSEADSFQALLDSWFEQFPAAGIFALVSEASASELVPFLQEQLSNRDRTVLGGVFPKLMYDQQFLDEGALLVLCREMPDYCLIDSVSRSHVDMDAVVSELISLSTASNTKPDARSSLLLLFDALIPNIGSILESLYFEIADDVNYIGANVGSETFQSVPCLFDNRQFIQDALLAINLPNHPGAILEHNYHIPDQLITATATSGNRIKTIDWRPAFEVYVDLVRSQYNVEITRDNFYQYGVHFPFGIMRMDGEAVVRIPIALEDDGSLVCVGEIPENSMLTLMEAVTPGSNETVQAILKEITPGQDDLILSFYCAGRRMHLDDKANSEFVHLSQQLQPSNIIGALSLGEIGSARRGGYPLYHNATIVCSSWI